MTSRDADEVRLRSLRERQAGLAAGGAAGKAEMPAVTREITVVASRLGFDPEEAAGIAARIDPPASGPGQAMAGEYRVLRGAADPILTFSALVIAGVVIGLGQPVAGGSIIVAAVATWFVRGALRVDRLDIDASGALSFPGRLERFDLSGLLRIDFGYRYPFGVSGLRKAASETVCLRLELTGDRSIKLARGALWRVRPRAPVAYYQLERHLAAMARDAGLTIEHTDTGWTARRP